MDYLWSIDPYKELCKLWHKGVLLDKETPNYFYFFKEQFWALEVLATIALDTKHTELQDLWFQFISYSLSSPDTLSSLEVLEIRLIIEHAQEHFSIDANLIEHNVNRLIRLEDHLREFLTPRA